MIGAIKESALMDKQYDNSHWESVGAVRKDSKCSPTIALALTKAKKKKKKPTWSSLRCLSNLHWEIHVWKSGVPTSLLKEFTAIKWIHEDDLVYVKELLPCKCLPPFWIWLQWKGPWRNISSWWSRSNKLTKLSRDPLLHQPVWHPFLC